MHTLPGMIAAIGTKIVNTVLTIAAVIMIIYSALVLYDTVYTNRAAFISDDLSQYRPVLTEEEPDFEGMEKINPDTRAWIILRDTNIDYPVVQGKDDVEYSMKNVYGESSLTGSIYLASVNNKDFTDSFNLIYGHHMNNGAMFGDIDKYSNMTYFFRHQEGLLITQRGAYDLHVFARLSADAYDSRIYMAGDHPASDFPDFLYYVQSLAVQWDPVTDIDGITENIHRYIIARDKNIKENGRFVFKKMPKKAVKDGMQLVALSTCADATTNGRQLLIATMKFRTKPLPDYYTDKFVDDSTPLAAWGHREIGHWALLNAVCVILIWIILLPGRLIKKKYGPLYTSAKKHTKGKKAADDGSGGSSKHTRLSVMDRLGILGRPEVAGIILEIFIAVFAVFWFFMTESIRRPMVIVDYWTVGMIVLAFIMWVVDKIIGQYEKSAHTYSEADAAEYMENGAK